MNEQNIGTCFIETRIVSVRYVMKLTDSNTPNNMKVVKSLAPSSQTTEMRLLTTVSVMA